VYIYEVPMKEERILRTIQSFVLLMLGVSTAGVAAPPGFFTIDVPGASNTQAFGINSHGDIVGAYSVLGVGHGYLLSGGVVTTIDFPGADGTNARGINSRGDIVGGYSDAAGVFHGFLLSGGVFTTIDFPGADTSSACRAVPGTNLLGINLHGDIVGNYSTLGVEHGFVLSRGTFTEIDVPGATCTQTLGISTAGDIVGFFHDADDAIHGFLLSGGTFTTIDVPPGTLATLAFGIDPSSTFIVGLYAPTNDDVYAGTMEHGFLLSGGIFATIDFPVPGVRITQALGVSPQGDIVGDYRDSLGKTHGFLFGKEKK
jgi:uncharacterized membrane protein